MLMNAVDGESIQSRWWCRWVAPPYSPGGLLVQRSGVPSAVHQHGYRSSASAIKEEPPVDPTSHDNDKHLAPPLVLPLPFTRPSPLRSCDSTELAIANPRTAYGGARCLSMSWLGKSISESAVVLTGGSSLHMATRGGPGGSHDADC